MSAVVSSGILTVPPFPRALLPIHCGTPSPPTCSRAVPICAPSRNSWATPRWLPPRSTHTYPPLICARLIAQRTRGRRATMGLKKVGSEVEELWGRYKLHGDQKARDELILAYSPLVKYVAGRMGTGLPCLLYTSPSPRDGLLSRMPSSA